MANDDSINDRNPVGNVDSKPAEAGGAVGSGETIKAQIGSVIGKELMGLVRDIADARIVLHSPAQTALVPLTPESRLERLENKVAEYEYWGWWLLGAFLGLLLIRGLRRD